MTAPECGLSSPDRTRRSVDLPAPFGPTSATVSPGLIDERHGVEERAPAGAN